MCKNTIIRKPAVPDIELLLKTYSERHRLPAVFLFAYL